MLTTNPSRTFAPATAAMTDDTIPLFSFPAVQGKKVTAAFDGGRMSSDGGVMLLSLAERRLGVAERLARCIPDRRDRSRIAHTIADMIRARVFAICCGYEDADDLDVLRSDPAFKLACGRLPDSGRDLCSQPTLSRLENAPGLKDVIRLTYALVDQWMASYATAAALASRSTSTTPATWRTAISSSRCSTPTTTSAAFCRSMSMTPRRAVPSRSSCVPARRRRASRFALICAGSCAASARAGRSTRILFRGDGHYARPEAMTWCEDNGVDYVFGLPGTKPLSRKVDETADAVRTERAIGDKDVVRGFAETRHRAGSWHKERRAVARIEATRLGLDIRFIVTNLDHGSAEWLYETLYCARGQAENLIKLHKAQLASDRTSCRSALANQVRLVLHTAAYWLMLAVRDAIPKARDLAKAEFATLRLKLLKIAARVVEMASRVRLAFAAACPEAELFASLPAALMPRGP